MSSSFDLGIENIAGRRAISVGIFASFVARQTKAFAAAIAPITSQNYILILVGPFAPLGCSENPFCIS